MKGVGGVGGSADVEYVLRTALMVPIASDKLRLCAGAEGTDVLSGPDGAATLMPKIAGKQSRAIKTKQKRPTDSGVLECWIRRVESSDCVTTESCG